MNGRKVVTVLALVLFGLLGLIAVGCTPTSLSTSFGFQGVLTNGSGSPLPDGTYSVLIRLYDDDTGGSVMHSETDVVSTVNGVFSTVVSPPMGIMDDPLWIDLTVEGEHLPTRQRIWGAPYALSLSPGAVVDGYVWRGDPVSATLNIANAGSGYALSVGQFYNNSAAAPAILAVNGNANTATVQFANITAAGDLLELWSGDGATTAFADREMVMYGNGNMRIDASYLTGGADYADMLPVGEGTEPGDVMVIGSDGLIILSTEAYDTRLAGIHSTLPAMVGGVVGFNTDENDVEQIEIMESLPRLVRDVDLVRAPVALTGAVPCKVSAENGAIAPGDLLVTSNTPGHAMRADPLEIDGVEFYPPGTILGRAMESLDSGTGVILVLISLN